MASTPIFELRLRNWNTKGPLRGRVRDEALSNPLKVTISPPNLLKSCHVYLSKNLKDIPKSRFSSQSRDFCQFLEGFGNFDLEKKPRIWFRKIWSWKKVSVLVLKNLVSEKKSRFRFRKIWTRRKSVKILVSSFSDHGTNRFHDSFVFITWQRWDRRRILKKPEGGDKKSSPLSFGRGGKKCRLGFGHLKVGSDSDKTVKRQIFSPCFGPRTT